MLAFMSGWLGKEVLSFLIQDATKPELVVVPNDQEVGIISLCQTFQVPYQIYYSGLQTELAKNQEIDKQWLLTIWSSIKLEPELIDSFENSLNIHPSLVPLNKGNDCAAWTLRDKTEAGVSIITVAQGIDDGDVYCQKKVHYQFPTKGAQLHEALLDACLNLFKENWTDIESGAIKPIAQTGDAVYHTRKQTNQDRVKEGQEVMSIQDTINWALSHDFNDTSKPEVIIDGVKYKVSVTLEA
ncbi:formyltransferase family protein [Pseudoalteromonas byunsanensis]|uniref:Formyl transferase N-terminal domain-containing protein n=1 Tax=Pseudoalteromonas byunsanensis TaxID=327939 RepID=A0A1S1N8U8_9GAMM|nr:formyltransferase family protein [Pseudoalteromonas byunsanensis]OHU95784.1 hypothetical protein BIW53_08115 [Pseudoalteromonas byunsanensis]